MRPRRLCKAYCNGRRLAGASGPLCQYCADLDDACEWYARVLAESGRYPQGPRIAARFTRATQK